METPSGAGRVWLGRDRGRDSQRGVALVGCDGEARTVAESSGGGVADLTWGPWICPLIGRKGSARKPCPICNFKGQIPQVKSATV